MNDETIKKLLCSRIARNRSAVACGKLTMITIMQEQVNNTVLRTTEDSVVASTWSRTLFRNIEDNVLSIGVIIVFVMVLFAKK